MDLGIPSPATNFGMDRGLRTAVYRVLAAASLLQLLRVGLRPPMDGTSIPKFVPVLLAHLAAPQLGVFCAAYAVKSVLGARQATSMGMRGIHVLGAALLGAAATACVQVLRCSMDGRTAFSEALAVAPFSSDTRSIENSSADFDPVAATGTASIGHLSTGRIAQMSVGIPLLEYPRLEITRDVEFAVVEGQHLYLDAIRRKGLQAGAPTLLYVHGGGFVIGDKSQHSLPLLFYVALKMGWLVITANYRLASWRVSQKGAVFPEFLHDCMRAVAWARSSESQAYGGGGSTLAVAGESAGAQLACLLGFASAKHATWMRPPDLLDVDLRVDAVVDLYGCHNAFAKVEYFQHIVLKCSYEENLRLWMDVSPVWWAQNACKIDEVVDTPPPFLTVHGTHDSLVPVQDARDFAKVMMEMRQHRADALVPDVYVEIPRAIHAFNMIHNPLTFALHDAVVRFLGAVATSRAANTLPSKL